MAMTNTQTPSPDALISATALKLRRGDAMVIDGLDLRLDAGNAVMITGKNGSGKTTMLRAMAGLLPIDGGTLIVNGMTHDAQRSAIMEQLIYIGHRDGLSSSLTSAENITHWAASRNLTPTLHDITAAFDALGLGHLTNAYVRHLSEGQRRRVSLVRLSLSHHLRHYSGKQAKLQGKIWLMDEPLTAIDDSASLQLAQLIDAHTEDGGGVILTSHSDISLQRCRALNLHEGNLQEGNLYEGKFNGGAA